MKIPQNAEQELQALRRGVAEGTGRRGVHLARCMLRWIVELALDGVEARAEKPSRTVRCVRAVTEADRLNVYVETSDGWYRTHSITRSLEHNEVDDYIRPGAWKRAQTAVVDGPYMRCLLCDELYDQAGHACVASRGQATSTTTIPEKRLKRLRENPDQWAGGVVCSWHELNALLQAYDERAELLVMLRGLVLPRLPPGHGRESKTCVCRWCAADRLLARLGVSPALSELPDESQR